jgi:hypothetical protein
VREIWKEKDLQELQHYPSMLATFNSDNASVELNSQKHPSSGTTNSSQSQPEDSSSLELESPAYGHFVSPFALDNQLSSSLVLL